jgi:HEAT repeat protein
VRRRLLLLLAVAVTCAPGCRSSGREGAVRPAWAQGGSTRDAGFDTPYQVLDEALRSAQPPLQAMACETYLESDRRPPLSHVEGLADARDPRVRATALALLGTMGRRELGDLFRRKQRDAAPSVRLAADFGLAMTVEPERMNALRDALAAPDVTVRRTAVWLLGLSGQKSAVRLLEVKLDDPDAVVVLRAAEAMHRLGSDAGLPRVRVLTRHSRHTIRYYAVRLLGRMGEQEDIPLLARLCQSRFLDVKFGAMAALARLGDFKRIGMLLDMLEAPDSQTRVLAARELGETAYTPAVPALERMLGSQVPLERTTAAASIVRIRSARQPWRSHILEEDRETK